MSHFNSILQILSKRKNVQTSSGPLRQSYVQITKTPVHTRLRGIQQPTLSIGSTVTLLYDCPEVPCPKMTVKKLTEESALCLWFTDATCIEVAEFPKNVLKLC